MEAYKRWKATDLNSTMIGHGLWGQQRLCLRGNGEGRICMCDDRPLIFDSSIQRSQYTYKDCRAQFSGGDSERHFLQDPVLSFPLTHSCLQQWASTNHIPQANAGFQVSQLFCYTDQPMRWRKAWWLKEAMYYIPLVPQPTLCLSCILIFVPVLSLSYKYCTAWCLSWCIRFPFLVVLN